MNAIRVVRGTGSGPTEMSAYDAALADAGIENYNLVAVSSVIPAGASVEVVETAPDLGPAGERLTVVEAAVTSERCEQLSAALAWGRSNGGEGPGLFYEASGEMAPREVEREVLDGLEAGRALRSWAFEEPRSCVETTTSRDDGSEGGRYVCVVAVAIYGDSDPIL